MHLVGYIYFGGTVVECFGYTRVDIPDKIEGTHRDGEGGEVPAM